MLKDGKIEDFEEIKNMAENAIDQGRNDERAFALYGLASYRISQLTKNTALKNI